MFKIHRSLCLFLGCTATTLFCSLPTAQAITAQSHPLEGSQIAVAYQLPGSNEVYGVNSDIYFHPASTQKLITALAASLFLGNDYTIKTRLQVQQQALNIGTDQKASLKLSPEGILQSDVTIRFSADPTLTIEGYRKLLSTLQQQGVKRIAGNVNLDVSRVGTPIRAQGWNWADIPSCFTAPASAVVLNRNCTFIELTNQGPGTRAQPKIPAGLPLKVISDAIAVDNRDYGGDCELEINLYQGNEYHLSGCIPADNNGKPFPLSLDVSDPVAWGVSWTQKLLTSMGIGVDGNVQAIRHPSNDVTTIAEIKSKPLGELIRYMLMRSNNLYADAIAKNTAAEYYSLPATYNRTARALRSILSQYADIDLNAAYLVDASGLSAHNLLTARELLAVLAYMKAHDEELHLIDMLPVAGKSGTLHWRASTVNAPLKLNVIAKTGTLQNVSNLAGFVRTKSGALAPFVMFTNAITYSERIRDRVKFRRMASPHLGYERYVLENIYAQKVMGRDF